MCLSYEASRQSHGVCMIPVLDIFLLSISVYLALVNAGTMVGWLMSIAVFVQTYLVIKFIREG